MSANKGKNTEVWPENWSAFVLFCSLETQWDFAGMGERCGLKYLVLFAKMERMSLTAQEWNELEDDIRTMEIAALQKMREKD